MASKTAKKPSKKTPKKPQRNFLTNLLIRNTGSQPNKKPKKHSPESVRPLMPRIGKNVKTIWKHRKAFALATTIYGLMYFVFVRVLTNVEFSSLQQGVVIAFGNGDDNIFTQIATIGSVFGESARLDNQSGLMYAVITIICSMAFIWILRKIHAEQRVSVKEAFYMGMYPLVPYTLLLLWIVINSLPFSITAFIFQTALNNGLTSTFIEKFFFVSLFAAGTVLSAYFAIGTFVASYAVTVPGVTPTEARRSAKGLLKGRRFQVLRQALIFLLLTAVVVVMIMLLFVWLWQDAVIVMTAIFLVLFIPWLHAYFYNVYLELLNDQG